MTNACGIVPVDEVVAILETGRSCGITMLDTAPAYGTAEEVLGRIDVASLFEVVTKTSAPLQRDGQAAGDALVAGLRNSLERLGRTQIDTLLLHHGGDLAGSAGLLDGLCRAKSDGLTRRIGVSVYRSDEIDIALANFTPDVVQVPLNCLDQRLLGSGHLRRLADRGVEIHARSAFLQGLLLADPASRPRWAQQDAALRRFDRTVRELAITPLRLCLGFSLSLSEVAKIVVGATSCAELAAIVEAARCEPPDLDWSELAAAESLLLDPRRWPVAV